VSFHSFLDQIRLAKQHRTMHKRMGVGKKKEQKNNLRFSATESLTFLISIMWKKKSSPKGTQAKIETTVHTTYTLKQEI